MATDSSFIDHVSGQAGLGSALSHRKMFGEYAFYLQGKVVALACDNQLFVKPTLAGRALLRSVTEQPPYPGAKPHWRVDAELDDSALLMRLLRATADALPMPKPKAKAKPKPKPSPTPALASVGATKHGAPALDGAAKQGASAPRKSGTRGGLG